MSKENQNICDKEIDASLLLNIGVREKESLLINKPEVNDLVPGTNDASKSPKDFLINGNKEVLTYLTHQLITSCRDFSSGDLDEIVKRTISLFNGVNPQDQVEAMLSVEMIATHNLSMELVRTATRETCGITIQHYCDLANKTLRTFALQMETLGKYRNKSNQKIVVEHVTVSEGGQAIVGSEINQGGGIK